jgi:organic hydroperoxide reductase OsmC/OhrA
MRIEAAVANAGGQQEVVLSTDGREHAIAIAPRATGRGSSANGGELLCLALATCYCNDVYREAQPRGIDVTRVEVRASAEFGAPGAAATRLDYRVRVEARASEQAIRELIVHTDRVAEIQNTLRLGLPVTLASYEAVRVPPNPGANP